MSASEDGQGNNGQARAAIKAAGVAAATSAAALAARHALGQKSQRATGGGGVGDAVSAGLEAAWHAARDVVLPALEDTAAAAGRWAAHNAPDAVRETLLPRFLEGFHEAREQREADDAEAERETKTTTGGER